MATAATTSHPLMFKSQEKMSSFALIISLIRVTWVLSSPIYQSLRPGALTAMVDLSLGNRNGLLLPKLSAFTRSQAVVVG